MEHGDESHKGTSATDGPPRNPTRQALLALRRVEFIGPEKLGPGGVGGDERPRARGAYVRSQLGNVMDPVRPFSLVKVRVTSPMSREVESKQSQAGGLRYFLWPRLFGDTDVLTALDKHDVYKLLAIRSCMTQHRDLRRLQ